jgi:large subunit ribosomal protein L18
MNSTRKVQRIKRHKRVRKDIFGTAEVPRLAVFRSSKHIRAQLIDDVKQKTLGSSTTLGLTLKKGVKTPKEFDGKKKVAYHAGKALADAAEKAKIDRVVFDRGGYKFHGRIAAFAQGAKDGGLKF